MTDKITVLGRDVPVVMVPGTDLTAISGEADCLGCFVNNTIYISSALQGDDKKRVLIHETVHAILAISGITALLEDNLEEAIATSLESLFPYANL